jgi:hypothetical protein
MGNAAGAISAGIALLAGWMWFGKGQSGTQQQKSPYSSPEYKYTAPTTPGTVFAGTETVEPGVQSTWIGAGSYKPEFVEELKAAVEEKPAEFTGNRIHDAAEAKAFLESPVAELREAATRYNTEVAQEIVNVTSVSYGQTPEQSRAQQQLGYDMINKLGMVQISGTPPPASTVTNMSQAQQAAREAVARAQKANEERIAKETTQNAAQLALAQEMIDKMGWH